MTPVNTYAKTTKFKLGINGAALFDVLLIAIMMSLLSSRFVVATGLGLNVDSADALPKINSVEYAHTDADLCVLTAKTNSMFIFGGSICNKNSLAKQMQSTKSKRNILLIKADKNLTIDELLEIVDIAKKSGFKKVHIAAKQKK